MYVWLVEEGRESSARTNRVVGARVVRVGAREASG